MGEYQNPKTARRCWADLPSDIWEIIIARFPCHHLDLEPVSLVCKLFLGITNHLRTDLTLYASLDSLSLQRYCTRFLNLRSIHLYHPFYKLDEDVMKLGASSIPLRSLHLASQDHFPREALQLLGGSPINNTLKTLCFTRLDRIEDDDLFVIADAFSYPHQLTLDRLGFDPHKRVTDRGISALSKALTSLVSFTFCGNELNSIELFSAFTSLTSLDLKYVNISETALIRLSQANLKLDMLAIRKPCMMSDVHGSTFCKFLKSCKSLRRLRLKNISYIAVISALEFVASIPNIQTLDLCNVPLRDPTILYKLLQSCPFLEEIVLDVGRESTYKGPAPISSSIRKLVLIGWELNDKILMTMGKICPNLESVIVGDTSKITDRGWKFMEDRGRQFMIYGAVMEYSTWKKNRARIEG